MQPHVRRFVERAITFQRCPECDGTRLTREARSSRINGQNIADLCAMQITDLADWVQQLDDPSVTPLLTGLQHLLDSFAEIGLGYLSLDRPAGTLSGGEAQRTKMIRHLGSSLTDVTYVFDEPTIGLHPHDIERMNDLLLQLRDKGNTVLVVEHKPETIAIADHVVDLGPGAGTDGGLVCFEGTVEGLRESDTTTGRHLDDRAQLKESVRRVVGRPGGPRCLDAQPPGRRRRHPARDAVRDHRCRRVRQELADPRLDRRPRRRGGGRPGRDQGFAAEQPRDVHRAARADPQGVRQGQRGQAGAVQLQLGGRVLHLQRCGRHLHRAGRDGDRGVSLRGVRGQAVPGRRAGVHARRQEHRRGARDAGHRGRGVLRRRRGQGAGGPQDPRPARRRRARLPQPRPAADDAVRRRAATAQAGHPDGREGRGLHPRRADHRPAPRRRREPAGPARPPGRLRQIGHRHRAPPGRDGARRLDHRPRARAPATTAARSSSRARRPSWSRTKSTLTGEHLAAYVD